MKWRGQMIVTTKKKPSVAQVVRAREVARRCAAPYVERRKDSLSRMRRQAQVEWIYQVALDREEITGPSGLPLIVHPGRFYLKRDSGMTHPYVRALRPLGTPEVPWVLDLTLGLAGDALHAAWALDAKVVGLEGSAPLSCLLEAGLRHMSMRRRGFARPASRVEVHHSDALSYLSALPEGAAPVVALDPMFETPLAAPPDYALFREFALDTPLSAELLHEACRVAARRVVLKIPGASAPPPLPTPSPGWNRRVRGRAVDYLIVEKELTDPEYEAPDLGHQRP